MLYFSFLLLVGSGVFGVGGGVGGNGWVGEVGGSSVGVEGQKTRHRRKTYIMGCELLIT